MNAETAAPIPANRIIQIIADGMAHAAEQAHLDDCARCRSALTHPQLDPERLRRQAALATPAPAGHFALPADPPERHALRRRRFDWAALGAVLSAALVVLFFCGKSMPNPAEPP